MSRFALFIGWVLVLLPATEAGAQEHPAPADTAGTATPAVPDSALTERVVPMRQVVVTATRSARALEDVAPPTSVITAEEIASQGAVRLSDLLESQPGLQLTRDHGTGLQVQGLGAQYTLVLIDGEPVVGRTAGTLELDRISVATWSA